MIEAAPAKLNLALHVTGRRPDGYHDLESLVVFADIGDELRAVSTRHDSFEVTGPFAAALGAGDGNLVPRAIAAFRSRWPHAVGGGLAVTLQKNLPVASGLGGGSADAAAALRLMASLAEPPIAIEDLADLALSLGADVPVCLYSRPADMRGIGERVTQLLSFPACHVVLVNPLVPLMTAEIFRHLQSRSNPPLPPLPAPLSRPAQLGIWLKETRNDLEATAIGLTPVVGAIIARVATIDGCILARMSGSGASVFGLFGSSAQAHQAAHDLRAQWPQFWVAAAPLLLPD